MTRKSFIFYGSWLEAINELPNEQRADCLRAIIEYGIYGEISENIPAIAKAMLAMTKEQIDLNNMRFDNGSKGGRPKNQVITKPKPKNNQTETKSKPSNNQDESMVSENVETQKPNYNYNDNDNYIEKNHSINRVSKKEVEQKHHYAPCVMLTESEYGKLVEAHGEDGAAWMVKKLDDYKAASGRTYKSDYRAILNWVVGEYRKHVAEQITGAYGDSGSVESNQDKERRKRNEEFQRHIARKLRGLEQ